LFKDGAKNSFSPRPNSRLISQKLNSFHVELMQCELLYSFAAEGTGFLEISHVLKMVSLCDQYERWAQ
jgi:hypothetical protein